MKGRSKVLGELRSPQDPLQGSGIIIIIIARVCIKGLVKCMVNHMTYSIVYCWGKNIFCVINGRYLIFNISSPGLAAPPRPLFPPSTGSGGPRSAPKITLNIGVAVCVCVYVCICGVLMSSPNLCGVVVTYTAQCQCRHCVYLYMLHMCLSAMRLYCCVGCQVSRFRVNSAGRH